MEQITDDRKVYIIDTESLWLGANSNTVITVISVYDLNTDEHKTYNLFMNDHVEFKNCIIIGWNCNLDITRLYSAISDDCLIIDLKEVYISLGKCNKFSSLDSMFSRTDNNKPQRMKEYSNIRKKLHLQQPLSTDDFQLQTQKCIEDVLATKELYMEIRNDIDISRFAKPKRKFYRGYLKYGSYSVTAPKYLNINKEVVIQ